MSLSANQQKRLKELERYVDEVKQVERDDFETWFEGKKEFCVNVGAWIILIQEDN